MPKIGHSEELQALRGLAAFCVLLHHSFRVLGPVGATGWVAETILNAHAAVVIFFVLSGYVLSKSVINRGFSQTEMTGYYIRRLFRIYPALWGACTLGLLYYLTVRTLPSPHFAGWAQRHYDPMQFCIATLFQSYLALSPFLDPPIWTILIEIVGSVLLPWIVLLFVRVRWSLIPVLVLLSAMSFADAYTLRGVLTYLVDFAAGAALAVIGTRRIGTGWPIYLACAVLVLFRQLHPWSYNAALPGLIEGLAAVAVIGGIVNGAFAMLSHSSLRRLGDISYSVYLLHLPIAYSVARVVDYAFIGSTLTDFGPILTALGTVLISLPLAVLSYRFIELPGVDLGRRLLMKWEARS